MFDPLKTEFDHEPETAPPPLKPQFSTFDPFAPENQPKPAPEPVEAPEGPSEPPKPEPGVERPSPDPVALPRNPEEAEKKATGKTNKQGRSIPTPKVPTRDPKNQNEHMSKIFHSKRLRGMPAAHHVALAFAQFMGLEHKSQYGKPTEAAARFLCEITGIASENTIRRAITHAIECGFFRRVDNGNGGKGGTNRAVYAPAVPDF